MWVLMKCPRGHRLRTLSVLAASAVLTCHVLGALCLMVPSVAMGEEAVVLLPSTHEPAMGAHNCWQYVPSGTDRFETTKPFLSSGPLVVEPTVPIAGWSPIGPPRSLLSTGASLFTYLCTFRL